MYNDFDDEPEFLTKFVLFHKRHSVRNDLGYDERAFKSWEAVGRRLKKDGAVVCVPVYAYDHSCFVLSHQIEPFWWHAAWDSGRLGWACVLRQDMKDWYGWSKVTPERLEKLTKIVQDDIQAYSNWLNGWSDDDDQDDETESEE